MIKGLFILIIFFAISAVQIVHAQNDKLIVINLKNGYSVKGEIIEQSAQSVKVRLMNGEIFEYHSDEIISITDSTQSSSAKAVPQIIGKGDKIINVGIGLFKQLPGSHHNVTIPPIPISFEYIVEDDLFNGNGSLGVGGFLGYTAGKEEYYFAYKHSRLIIGARGYVHYALVEKLDTYAGVLLGYKSDVTKFSDSDHTFSDVRPTLNIFAGCRYFINDKFAGMAELGWGISLVTVGVAVKL